MSRCPRFAGPWLLCLLAACNDTPAATSASAPTGSTTGTTAAPGPMTGETSEAAPPTTTAEPGSEGSSTNSTSSTTSTSTGEAVCSCAPGDLGECEGAQILVCQADCSAFAPQPCGRDQACAHGSCEAGDCPPNSSKCVDDDHYAQCNGEGSGYGPPVACGPAEACAGSKCFSLCDLAESTPSTVGCSFFASRMDNYYAEENDSLVIGNTHASKTATVQLYLAPTGQNVEAPQGPAVKIGPGETHTFTLTNPPIDKVSALRVGGAYRVDSDVPVVAYQHSPIGAQATNDASMLFPEHALQASYVVASYRQTQEESPSYFTVIAIAEETTVRWTPPITTSAGKGVPQVFAGQTGEVVMNRFDTLQVIAPGPSGDLSGTIVSADRPIWVVGAVECVNVPSSNVSYCDHVEEQMLPLAYWGREYVGAHAPARHKEKHYWRVFGGEDGTTVSTVPPLPGTPLQLNRGEWQELVVNTGTSFVFAGDKPFLPVQYLESQDGGGGTGDPAMVQAIPVEQFLDRYAFATGTGYSQHFAQIVRIKGGAEVQVDGVAVGGYYAVGGYEVADWPIAEGGHLAASAEPFGIVNYGYTDVTSYAYPGGTRLEVINPQ
ncbi:IgGFc-binding protein [Nannocystis bainbridge]|uniref:IgGFc-binding protein n=1 Tax=Nannocystis bainbridge TaxID=2995303 RepID=A0ABT5E981_9BACT|nr:IgGFc-binding protein [Nannocystis bainbridge]MDC0721321.1 IgGFc-binding protein [Nannocystis bainbridge]